MHCSISLRVWYCPDSANAGIASFGMNIPQPFPLVWNTRTDVLAFSIWPIVNQFEPYHVELYEIRLPIKTDLISFIVILFIVAIDCYNDLRSVIMYRVCGETITEYSAAQIMRA